LNGRNGAKRNSLVQRLLTATNGRFLGPQLQLLGFDFVNRRHLKLLIDLTGVENEHARYGLPYGGG
jgi:hypothetical protein